MITPMIDFLSTICLNGGVVVLTVLVGSFFGAYINALDTSVNGALDD